MQTVLLIEDSRFLRIANERLLAKAGYRVISAEDGEEALRKIHLDREHPDIILLDMMMPKMSGPEVLKALKQDSVTARIPVIVLTSLSQKNEAKLLREGAAAYIEKSRLQDNHRPLLNAIEKLTNATREQLKSGGNG
jgi:CheY-like chemotaxis protein